MKLTRENTYIEGTRVRITAGYNKGKLAVIVHRDFFKDGIQFQNYRVSVDGREGLFAAYHQDVELISRPSSPE